MRRTDVRLGLVLLFAASAACSSATTTLPDGATVSSNVESLCNRLADYQRRCGLPQCQIDDQQRQCLPTYSHLRSEVLTAVDHCLQDNTLMCPADGGGGLSTSNAQQCFGTTLSMISVTPAQRDAAAAICNACPAAGGSSTTTTAECVQSFFAVSDGGTTGVGGLVRMLDDPTTMQVTACAMASSSDAGSACSLGIFGCVLVALGTSFGTSSCTDGGVMDARMD